MKQLERLALPAAALILGLFAVSMAVDMFNRDYDPPPALYFAVSAVVLAIFGNQVLKRNGNGGR
jgi:hypothetical protein